ncbi:hypothetical protein HPB52_012240 [Rhipicephalus sanguineus]|uniref:CCHC-type domain-containing protein n=1 Tax=Rhipicephalus sanguineus TaxID=34632 RepID=A0A9D4Q0Q1_RHISA|nr:hypothetical protein HPB52_012240 [Rhipicephalus sanguineus]
MSTVQLCLKAQTLAKEMGAVGFVGGPSWCSRCMRRKALAMRAHTSMCQTLPADLKEKLERCQAFTKKAIENDSIGIAMNRSFKAILGRTWESWMTEGDHSYTETGRMRCASFSEVAKWVRDAWCAVLEATVTANFRKAGRLASAMPDLDDESSSSDSVEEAPASLPPELAELFQSTSKTKTLTASNVFPAVMRDISPTGCESTELHGEGELTPRDGATPRCTSSSDSEATIVESLLMTLDSSTMATATKKQLIDELRVRGLRCSGRKDELIARLPTDSSMNNQAADDNNRQAHLETLSADNARLRAELNSLRTQLNCATTSEQRGTLYNASHNASLPTKWVTTSTNGLHHSVPADTTMSSGSTQSSSLNDGTNQEAERPTAPTVSTHGGEPSMAQILAAFVNTQALLANSLSRVERIAALAHWTPSLMLVTAASRLTGSAKDWHSANSSQHDTWEQWKEALNHRFKRKLTMQEFLEQQTKRRLQSHETIVEYMHSKNAILNKARLAEEERISLILSGIEDDTWANPLAAQLCGTATELINRAALLDGRRRMTVRGQDSNQRAPASSSANLPTANSRSDSSGAPRRRPTSARSCFNCGDIAHLSRDCSTLKTPATIRADEKRAKRDYSSQGTGHARQANCFLHSTGGTLPVVSGTANNRPVRVCIDSGANISIVSARPTHAWVSREDI